MYSKSNLQRYQMTSAYPSYQFYGGANIPNIPADHPRNNLNHIPVTESRKMRINHNINDLSTLEVLDHRSVINTLRFRFNNGLYYTYIGDIIVSINPCEPVNLYEEKDHAIYTNLYERSKHKPHIYWIADELYRNLKDFRDQCVIVSGVSGAGKTESIKHILSHLIQLGPNNVGNLVQQLEEVNPLLELFGNATTTLNKNSSRFCKFIELQYSEDNQLQNGQIQSFIFEKSRLIQKPKNEKNFHIFYAILGSETKENKDAFHLGDVSDYTILQGENDTASVFVDSNEFQEFQNKYDALETALPKIGFKPEEIGNIYSVLSAILNLTNIKFYYQEELDILEVDDCEPLQNVSDLLSIDVEALRTSLLFTKFKIDDITKPKTLDEANEGRDALAKELYNRLFSCIIEKINAKLKESVPNSVKTLSKKLPTINLLDISGFENLAVNGFEQLLINSANEVLHQIFLKHIMKQEQDEYEEEGVEWSKIDFRDNTDVIDLLLKPKTETSIFSILEEEALIATSCDNSFLRKLNQNFNGHERYISKNEHELQFGIKHYAAEVNYNAIGFIEKSKDTLSSCLADIIYQSKNQLLMMGSTNGSRNSGYRNSNLTKDFGIKRSETVTKQFRNSLRQLQTKLTQSKLMFVRCLKPNTDLKPKKFDYRCMEAQLIACGLADAAKFRRHGFPIRMTFAAFANKYDSIYDSPYSQSDLEKCKRIVKISGIEKVHFGKTKILLNYQEKEILEKKVVHMDLSSGQISRRSSFSSNGHYQEAGKILSRHNTPNIRKRASSVDFAHIAQHLEEDTSKNVDNLNEQTNESNIPAYDAFRETERDIENDSDFFTKVLKFFRLLFYLCTFFGILSFAVSNRIGLLLLAGSRNKDEDHGKLFISLGLPMVFSWIANAMKCAFRGKVSPSWKSYICIGLVEIFRTLANTILVFLILPNMGIFRGLIMIYGIGQIPALLLLLETIFGKQKQSKRRLFMKKLIYFFVFIFQVGVLPAYVATNFLYWTDKDTNIKINHIEFYNYVIPIIIIVISLSLWENYALFDMKMFGRHLPLNRWRKRMMKDRESTNLFIEPIKILLFWFVSWELSEYDLEKCWKTYKTTIDEPVEHLRHFGIMYLEIISALICTYLSGMACKLHMQKFGFALPLVLVTPVSLILSILQCEYKWIPRGILSSDFRCCKLDFLNELLSPFLIIVITFITTLAITVHIWKPESERMALLSKLFVPRYDPILLDTSLLLRRRQDHKENKEKNNEEGQTEMKRPKLIVCATTWHETRQEMLQILKSLFRLDHHQVVMNITTKNETATNRRNTAMRNENDTYDLEIHIIFDDSWEYDEESGQEIPNGFVKEFVSLIPEALTSVAKGMIKLKPIEKNLTPYGGRLNVEMPGGTKMVIHLKNKDKIRHRKRWSQVMYLYYLLGFKIFGKKETADKLIKDDVKNKVRRNVSLLNHLSEEDYKEIDNTFLLTLDGDVDFKPDSVKLLLDRMLKNKKVGAVCGRIHPIGSGPMIWYQQFEYAVGHWLQKAAEHVFGCVLCCPGCFSLFRASAIMDDNVMKSYTKKPIVARDFIQYEQGEDRWLCTLLLQQGYKIDYCAGADAYTFAPESFHDFYIQRRRWAPSTIANIMDLLSTWRTTVYLNDNISVFFMFYQFILMASSILAPATVVLMIAGSFNAVLKISMWNSFLVSLTPVVIFIGVCFKTKTNTQINVAAMMTTIYSVVMVIVTVGTIINIIDDNIFAPNVMFLVGLASVFIVCGLLHPREIVCLIHGIIYFLTVPSSFIFLTIYFLCNLNIVSWGTREVVKKLSPEEQEQAKIAEEEKLKKKKEKRFLNTIGILPLLEEIKKIIYDVLGKQPGPPAPVDQQVNGFDVENPPTVELPKKFPIRIKPKTPIKPKADPYYWTNLPWLGKGSTEIIEKSEKDFWDDILKKYLHPLKENKEEKEKIKNDLEMTRNNVVFGYLLLNLLWSVAIMQLQTMKDEMLPFFIAEKYEPISVMFLGIFGIVLFLQFFGMCIHRWGTFLHLMSTTHLMSNDFEQRRRATKLVEQMASASTNTDIIPPDYSSSECDSDLEDEKDILPPIDYESGNELNAYEQLYKDRLRNFKSNRTCRRRFKKTYKGRAPSRPILEV